MTTRNFTTSNRAAAEELICIASLYEIDFKMRIEDEENSIYSYDLTAAAVDLDSLTENEINRNDWTIRR